MMKKIAIIITYLLLSFGCILGCITASMRKKHIKELQQQVKYQKVIIDSLLNRRMTIYDVKLNVTDKSKFAIYGRYNKGTITVPNERTYTLELDSFNIKTK